MYRWEEYEGSYRYSASPLSTSLHRIIEVQCSADHSVETTVV
jgi:hypothetical protein